MTKAHSQKIRRRARSLRQKGWSIGEISLKMSIPKNTLSSWFKDIVLSQEQNERIEQKILTSAAIGRKIAARLLRLKMEGWKEKIRKKAQCYNKLSSSDPVVGRFICGLLYLCEGAKYPSSRYLHLGNSDPKIISFFINTLRKSYKIEENKLRFSIGYRWDQNHQLLKSYWSKVTKIPESKCLNSKPDIRTKGKPTLRKDYMGICKIIYYNTTLQFELQSIGETIINKWSRRGSNPRTSCMPCKRSPN